MQLSPSFVDVFLLVLLCVVVMVKEEKNGDENPPEMAYFVVNASWSKVGNDIDLWGKRIGVEDSECGFTRREKGNLALRNDWTGRNYANIGNEKEQSIAHESMTIQSLSPATYHFSLQGYRVSVPTKVDVSIYSTKPYRLILSRQVTVSDGSWSPIARFDVSTSGSVDNISIDIQSDFSIPRK